jgi:hypothetical protein
VRAVKRLRVERAREPHAVANLGPDTLTVLGIVIK